jgi:hypothetical protein
MQTEWLLIAPAIFGLGFQLGYFVRARISWRRRRRSRHAARAQPGDAEQIPLRLEQPQRNDVSGSSDDAGRAELRKTNAPPLAGIDLGRSSAALPRK